MYGKCKNCNKLFSCNKPIKYKFGFCETDFEPKPKPQAEPCAGMIWKQLSGTEWEAKGRCGVFKIERARGRFWSHYANSETSFKMPPKAKLSEAKGMCEDNEYWEGAV